MRAATDNDAVRHPLRLFFLAALTWLALDQLVKFIQTRTMQTGQSLALWPGVFHLTSVRNTGAAFSLLEGHFLVFYLAMAVLVVLVLWFWLHEKPSTPLPVLGTALIVAGAVGNMLDRIAFGYVRDIFDIRLINFAIFNVADFGITIGCILFFLWVLFFGGLSNQPAEDSSIVGTPTDPPSQKAVPTQPSINPARDVCHESEGGSDA
jgi:signal peptidase II